MNNEAHHHLDLTLRSETPLITYATITVSPHLVESVYRQAIASQQPLIDAVGFPKGATPLEYIEKQLKATLTEHTKEFLLNFWVINFLYDELRNQKIIMAGKPRLHSLNITPPDKASFTFEISVAPTLTLLDWHYFPFKAPKRKNYKDLDRQVELFLKEEKDNLKKYESSDITLGDWVHFDIAVKHGQNGRAEVLPKQSLWLKLGDEEVDSTFRELFINKKVNEHFVSNSAALQEYFSAQLNTNYAFDITVTDVVKSNYFCLEQFKKHFKLKSNKEIQQKLIEVFSYRNDISLRRSIAEESLKLILAKHKFDIPHHLVLRQQQILLEVIQMNPDYHVYRAQKDFQLRLEQLAERQAKEAIIIDSIAYADDIVASEQDLKGYINLLQRPRTKEFIYFDPPMTKQFGQELPVSTHMLKHNGMREKALNTIIHQLTKQ